MLRIVVFALVGLCAAGCNPSELYVGEQRSFAPGAITAKRRWRVSGGLGDVRAATDGSAETVAVSGRNSNAALTIDLGEACMFNMVVVDHGASGRDGYAGRLAVSASIDGRNFTRLASVPGTRRVTLVNIITPHLARYVRLQVVGRGPEPWSVAEVHIQ